MSGKNVAIIGAGIAGLCSGVYAQLNGYKATIYEQHNRPGGLCTAWRRQGYTVDFCIHWLVGSKPGTTMHRLWSEVGLTQDLRPVELEEFSRFEATTGETVIFYRDLERTRRHLIENWPADAALINSFFRDALRLVGRPFPVDFPPGEMIGTIARIRSVIPLLPVLRPLQRWSKVTLEQLGADFKSPALREAFAQAWHPTMAATSMLVTLAWLHDGQAAYPRGGSQPLADAIERRLLELGGRIEYDAAVSSIDVEGDRAIGVIVGEAGREPADWVISAADGRETIFDLLGGRYIDDTVRGYYGVTAGSSTADGSMGFDAGVPPTGSELERFPSLVFVGVGVDMDLSAEPHIMSGWNVPADPSLPVGEAETPPRVTVRVHNFDPELAPPRKTLITVSAEADFAYWRDLAADGPRYAAAKQKLADAAVALLDRRYPGLSARVEMVDVATPHTIERYTRNWMGSYEGWLLTPKTQTMDMRRSLQGLDGFLMAGQWIMPGGGLPSGIMSGRQAVQLMCRADGRRFVTSR